MSMSTILCRSFRHELPQGIHNLETDELRVALFTPSVVLNADTYQYSPEGEAMGDGYTPGGAVLPNKMLILDGNDVYLLSDPVEWAAIDLTFDKFLLYNATKAGRAIASYHLGQEIGVASQPLRLVPQTIASNSWLRF